MTIFKQQIDPSQVILEWTIPTASTLIVLGAVVLALCSYVTLPLNKKAASKDHNPSKAENIKDALIHAVIGTLCFIATLTVITNPLSIDKLTQPAFGYAPGERVPLNFTQKDKTHITDLYRSDINAAIDNKLKGYNLADTINTASDERSVLTGGKLTDPVLVTKNGTTYTLTPEWSYDSSNHTVKLTVTTQEGDHRDDK